MDSNNTSWINNLPRWIPTILIVVSFLLSWGGAVVKFSSLQNEVESLKTQIKTSDQTSVTLQIDIREIKTSLEFIKEKIQ